jgi:hypothetical protein
LPYYFETVDQAKTFLSSLIPQNSTIGFGGSVTVKDMRIPELFRDRGDQVFYRGFPISEQEKESIFEKIHTAEWFISSTNALTINGDLINIDGRANRVAEMLFGPKNVVIVTGVNKITSSIEEGISRVRNVAAPKNCVKLNKDTPCAKSGKCSYCGLPNTICRTTVIQHHPTFGQNVYIIIVNKNLGF